MKSFCLTLALCLICGCTSNKSSNVACASHYTVHGKQYCVLASSHKFTQKGIASWYGPKYHGRKTASGQKYNMHKMTAAHPSLPLGSKVKVKNLDNGKSVIVTINDRGPFRKKRVLDVSYKAAKKLAMTKHGTATVSIKAIS